MPTSWCCSFWYASTAASAPQPKRSAAPPQSVNERMNLLEAQVGEPLIIRRPTFMVTAKGEEFFREAAEPIGRALQRLHEKERPGAGEILQVAASEYILQEYLLPVVARLQQTRPDIRVTLRSGQREQLETWLSDRAIHLVVQTVDEPTPGFGWLELFPLPLVLLVPTSCGIKDATTALQQTAAMQPLASPPPGEGISRRFQATLRARGVHCPVKMDASCTALMPWIVAHGQAMGPCVNLPELVKRRHVRALPLDDFAPVHVGILHGAKLNPAAQAFLELAEERGRELAEAVKLRPTQ